MKFFCVQNIIYILAIVSAIDASNKKSKGKKHKSNKSIATNTLTNELKASTNKSSISQGPFEEINNKQQKIDTKSNEPNKNSLNQPTTLQSLIEQTNNKKEIKTTKSKNNSSNESSNNKAENNSHNQTTCQPIKQSNKMLSNCSSLPDLGSRSKHLNEAKSRVLQNLYEFEKSKTTETNNSSEIASTSRVRNNKIKQQIYDKTTESLLSNNDSDKAKLKAINESVTSDKLSPELSDKASPSRVVKRNKNKQKISKTATENSLTFNDFEKIKLNSIEQSETSDNLSELHPELFLNNEVEGWTEKARKYSREIEKAEERIVSSYEKQLLEKLTEIKQTGNIEVDNWKVSLEADSGLVAVAYAKNCSLMRLNEENWKNWTPYQKYIASEEIITNDITYIMAALENYMYMGYFKDSLQERDDLIGRRMNVISDEYFEFKSDVAKESTKQKRIKENREHVCKKRNGQYATANEICDVLRELFFWKGQKAVECTRAYVNNHPDWGQEDVALCKLEWPKKGAIRFINDPFTGMILDAAKAGPDITLGILDGKFPHGFWLAAVLTKREPHRVKIINQFTYVKNSQMSLDLPTAMDGVMEGIMRNPKFELYKPEGLSYIDAAHKVVEWVMLKKSGDVWDPETGVFSSYIRQREKNLKEKEKIKKLFPKK